jgi:hypothetical protein
MLTLGMQENEARRLEAIGRWQQAERFNTQKSIDRENKLILKFT